MTEYSNLQLICLTAEQRQGNCGYWYLIQHEHRAHTAFDAEDGVIRFCIERGLTYPDGALSHRGEFAVHKLGGKYRSSMVMTDNPADVEAAPGHKTRVLSNGEYVVANIVTDPDGVKHVYTLNPNVRSRRVFDYHESRQMMGGAKTTEIPR